MSATNFNTKNDTYRKLMGNVLTYRIPRFQRDYSWTEEEWEDLWMDILGTIKGGGEPAHYMGYLVLQSDDDKTFDVIDGQQRLTTMNLINALSGWKTYLASLGLVLLGIVSKLWLQPVMALTFGALDIVLAPLAWLAR